MNKFELFSDARLGERYYYLRHESGLDIYVFPKESRQRVALLGVNLGSLYEEGAQVDGVRRDFSAGIAHFLEHKLFSSEDGVDAFERLASLGADANAYTSTNKTVYYFNCTDHFYEALKCLVGFVSEPYFTKENVESEKGIIIQEMRMYLDSPYEAVSQNLLRALYGEGKLSADVIGTEETVRGISEGELYSCYKAFYRPSNMVLAVCGDVSADEVLSAVEKSIPALERGDAPMLPVYEYGAGVSMPYIERLMPVACPIFEIGIKDRAPSADADERFLRDAAMTVLDEIIFSRAGELYTELFESGYINESYSYGYTVTRDAAFHSIYAEGENPHAVLDIVKRHIARIKREGICERDFVRCKRVMMAEYIRDFDSPEDIANSLMNLVIEGGSLFGYREIIEKVTIEDVRRCLETSFAEESFALSVIKNA